MTVAFRRLAPLARLLPLIVLVLAAAGCRRPRPWNVLVITLDTTRADVLGCYGRSSARTPNLDRLAAEGFLFRQAVSAAPITLPSHATLFTGTYPPVHGVRDNGLFQLPAESETLAEILAARGWATGAAIGAFPLARQFGIGQGFAFFDDRVKGDSEELQGQETEPRGKIYFDERSAVQVNDAILPWIREHLDQPFFAWIHYWDAHHPLVPPAPFDQLFEHDLYQGEVAFVDESLGAVLRALREGGVDDRTLIVVVGDHGEGRGDHYEDTHSMLAYDSTLRVPLILRVPGMAGGKQVARRVGTVDVLPTVLELLGIERPAQVQGRSLARWLRAPAGEDEPAARGVHYAETLSPRLSNGWGELRALYEGRFKYIHGPRPELFDLEADPGETRNLVAGMPAETARMRQTLQTFLDHQPHGAAASAVLGENAEVRERLAALGYLSAGGEAPENILEKLRDGGIAPQERVGDNSLSSLVKQKISAGQFLAARDAAEGLVARDPGNAFYRGMLAMAWLGMGRPERAADVIEDASSLVAQNDNIFLQVAQDLFTNGERDRARAILERLLAQRASAAGRYLLAEMFAELGEAAAHERELRAALALDEKHRPARLSLAIVLAGRGERAAAEALFVGLLRDHPRNARYHFNYAVLLLEPPDPAREAEAIGHLERTIELSPAYWKARLKLLAVRLARGERGQAETIFRELEESCTDPAILQEARARMAPGLTED